jgi:hypothetical protein
VQQHHVGMLGVDLIELGPDQAMIVEVEPAGECDFRPCGQEHLVVGALLRGEEVAAVDHRRGEIAVVDLRSVAWPPGRMGVAFELVGGPIAHQLEGVAALDQRRACPAVLRLLNGKQLLTVFAPIENIGTSNGSRSGGIR